LSRRRHPDKEVEAVLAELEEFGWTVVVRGSGHAWALLRCPYNSEECRCGEFCQMSVNSTPQNAGSHALKLKNRALSCVFLREKDADG
jgi:hypothetical protein